GVAGQVVDAQLLFALVWAVGDVVVDDLGGFGGIEGDGGLEDDLITVGDGCRVVFADALEVFFHFFGNLEAVGDAGGHAPFALKPGQFLSNTRGGAGLALAFVVEVLHQVAGVQIDLCAAFGDVLFGGPEQGVDNQAAEIFIAPVFVIVRAGETEAAAAVGAIVGPGHVFGFAFVFLHFGIAAVGVVDAGFAAGAFGRNIRENR